jgi:hypothetical protein
MLIKLTGRGLGTGEGSITVLEVLVLLLNLFAGAVTGFFLVCPVDGDVLALVCELLATGKTAWLFCAC